MGENALTVIDRITDPVASAQQMGKACAMMCRARSEEEGQVIWLHCMMEGISPIQFMRRYHMIDGKPSMRADAMLGEWRMQGGNHKVIESSHERAAIKLIDRDGHETEFELTWKECEESRWPWKNWKDHSEGLKDNWSTQLDRKNMLWARLVSDSLRRIAPELVAGVYTPEEMADAVFIDRPATQKPAPSASEIIQAAAEKTVVASAEEVIDVPFETAEEEKSKRCTKSQRDKIHELFAQLAIPQEKQEAALKKRGVSSLNSLTKDQAQEMIDRLIELKASRGN